ncbi:hypothetical protein Tco_1016999 [Tanacetum coccineum]|uniref:Tf2-1-like SH3-like domain-containing protein n=1 Tax=Tanacetum coccineum TaxID=301880 RepID=A0ABQ5FQS2_9ASTR
MGTPTQGLGANGDVEGVNGNVEGANGGAPDFSMILQNLLPAMLAQVSMSGEHKSQRRCSKAVQIFGCTDLDEAVRYGQFKRLREKRNVGVRGRNVNPVNARNSTVRACYECGSTDHVRSVCPRWNRAQGPGENRLNQVAANNGRDVLLVLPPIREIEFRIELIPGATSVAKSPYHLAPSELEELSGQHQGTPRQDNDKESHCGPIKIEVVNNWKAPRTPTKELAFQTLKDKLCNAPVLALPDRPEDFVVKAEHQRPSGLFSNLEILYEKMGRITLWILRPTVALGLAHVGRHNQVIMDPMTKLLEDLLRAVRPWSKEEVGMFIFRWLSFRITILIGPELVQETTEKISQIKVRLKAAWDRQKSYVDKRRKPLEFSVGDYVLLKVSPWKGVVRFGKKGKLAPRFVGPFEIIEKVGPVAYRLDLPEELNGVHDTFHVSNLKKCLADPTLQVPLDEIRVDAKLNFVEEYVVNFGKESLRS